jgi:hypothetical protein
MLRLVSSSTNLRGSGLVEAWIGTMLQWQLVGLYMAAASYEAAARTLEQELSQR